MIALSVDKAEEQRAHVQYILDAEKTGAERNKLGQFATPSGLAIELAAAAKHYMADVGPIRFLDPAVGTGVFFYAAKKLFGDAVIAAQGFEVDPKVADAARQLWSPLGLTVESSDFTRAPAPLRIADQATFLICNPPYVRHHHLSLTDKKRLQQSSEKASGVRVGGLAGLYCYFIALSHGWMRRGAIAAWLVPSEFMAVNYGAPLRGYLTNVVKLLRIHRFDPNDVQFDDAIVSSAVVFFSNQRPDDDAAVEFTFGGTLAAPARRALVATRDLRDEPKWIRFPEAAVRELSTEPKLRDLFTIKRGLATGANNVFILSPEQVASHNLPEALLRPILPAPRTLTADEVHADERGYPILEQRRFLLDCRLPEKELRKQYPSAYRYLKKAEKAVGSGYLCSKRSPWYLQENRPSARLLCTYIGRSDNAKRRPFRFILNHSDATAANVYLMLYPKPAVESQLKLTPSLTKAIWELLNSIPSAELLTEGRVYGGGLHKVEPAELGNVSASAICQLLGIQTSGRAYNVDLFTKRVLAAGN